MPSWALIAFAATVFTLSVFTVRYSNTYVNWVRASSAYEQWHSSEERKICEAIEKSCLAEYETEHPSLKNEASDFDKWLRVREMGDAKYQRCLVEKNVKKARCFSYHDPGNVSEYFVSEYYFGDQLAQFLVLLVAPIYLLFCVRCFYAINHLGWQRITLVSAVFISVVFSYGIFPNTHRTEPLLFVSILGVILFLTLLVVPVFLRTFFVWISDGFKPQGVEQVPKFETQTSEESKEVLNLTWRTALPILKYAAIALAVSLLLIARPESTLKTFVAVLVQGIILIAGISIYRRFKRR